MNDEGLVFEDDYMFFFRVKLWGNDLDIIINKLDQHNDRGVTISGKHGNDKCPKCLLPHDIPIPGDIIRCQGCRAVWEFSSTGALHHCAIHHTKDEVYQALEKQGISFSSRIIQKYDPPENIKEKVLIR